MPWQTQQQQIPWTQTRGHLPLSTHRLQKKNKSCILTLNTIFPLSPFPSFPFVSSISNLCLESQQSSSAKAVCSTHHQHFYRSAARRWWFVPVLRQNYSLPLSQYRLLPLSGAIPPADTEKKKKTWGERMKEFHPTTVWIADGTWVTIWYAIVSVSHRDNVASDSHL